MGRMKQSANSIIAKRDGRFLFGADALGRTGGARGRDALAADMLPADRRMCMGNWAHSLRDAPAPAAASRPQLHPGARPRSAAIRPVSQLKLGDVSGATDGPRSARRASDARNGTDPRALALQGRPATAAQQRHARRRASGGDYVLADASLSASDATRPATSHGVPARRHSSSSERANAGADYYTRPGGFPRSDLHRHADMPAPPKAAWDSASWADAPSGAAFGGAPAPVAAGSAVAAARASPRATSVTMRGNILSPASKRGEELQNAAQLQAAALMRRLSASRDGACAPAGRRRRRRAQHQQSRSTSRPTIRSSVTAGSRRSRTRSAAQEARGRDAGLKQRVASRARSGRQHHRTRGPTLREPLERG